MAKANKEKFVVNPARKIIEGIRSDILLELDRLHQAMQGKTTEELVTIIKTTPELVFLYYCGAAVETMNNHTPDRMAPNAAREIRKWIIQIVGSFRAVREEYEAALTQRKKEIVEICEQVNEYARQQAAAESE